MHEGTYVNGFLDGRTSRGAEVAIVAGHHVEFPYADRHSSYDQVAIYVQGRRPLVITGRPTLHGLRVEPGSPRSRIRYRSGRASFSLTFRSVAYKPIAEGYPFHSGDILVDDGLMPRGSPGLVYRPFELDPIARATVKLDGRRLTVRHLHGQLESGDSVAPRDRRSDVGYDYVAAPTLSGPHPYTYVGFFGYALHKGLDGVGDSYYRETTSDQLTMQEGDLYRDDRYGSPRAFDNTGPMPPRVSPVARWSVNLGPGTLHRVLAEVRDRAGRPLLALSETITENR